MDDRKTCSMNHFKFDVIFFFLYAFSLFLKLGCFLFVFLTVGIANTYFYLYFTLALFALRIFQDKRLVRGHSLVLCFQTNKEWEYFSKCQTHNRIPHSTPNVEVVSPPVVVWQSREAFFTD